MHILKKVFILSFIVFVTLLSFFYGYFAKRYSIFPTSIIESNIKALKLKIEKDDSNIVNFSKKNIVNYEFKIFVDIDEVPSVIENGKIIKKFYAFLEWNPFLVKDENFYLYYDDKIAKLSNDKTTIWENSYKGQSFHHWGSNDEENLYILSSEEIKKKFKYNSHLDQCLELRSDTVLVIDDKDGSIKKKINIFEDVYLKNNLDISQLKYCKYILHINDVVYLNKKNFFKKEALMFSSKHDNSVIIVDLKTLELLFYKKNLTFESHSPRIYQNKYLLIYDNGSLRDDYKFGRSRIFLTSLENKNYIRTYEGNENYFLHSYSRGKIQIFNDKLFILSNNYGELIYLDCKILNINNDCNYSPILKEENSIFNTIIF